MRIVNNRNKHLSPPFGFSGSSPQDFPTPTFTPNKQPNRKKKQQNNSSGNPSHPHFRPKKRQTTTPIKPPEGGRRLQRSQTRFFAVRPTGEETGGTPSGRQDASKVWRICIRSWITVHVGSNGLMPRSGWVGGWEIVGGWVGAGFLVFLWGVGF